MASDRLGALKRAQWRAKLAAEGVQRCRVCGGTVATFAKSAYCHRHWKMLRADTALMAAVARGERYAEADALIELKTAFKAAHYTATGNLQLTSTVTLRQSSRAGHDVWVLRYLDPSGHEHEEGVFVTVAEALRYLLERRADWSARNRYARKALIG